jgi:hypothetical protein
VEQIGVELPLIQQRLRPPESFATAVLLGV